MSAEPTALERWLAAKNWRFPRKTPTSIPQPVLAALQAFVDGGEADAAQLDLYQAALLVLFDAYRLQARAHKALLMQAVLRLARFSRERLWRCAFPFFYMEPDFGREAIRLWVAGLALDASEERELETNLFHAYR